MSSQGETVLRNKTSAEEVNTDECIEWDGCLSSNGYGKGGYGPRGSRGWDYAHRFVWMEERGEIPEGMYVLHKCDNRPCINIDHLFLGTALTNSLDARSKGRCTNQKKTHCKRGHPLVRGNLIKSKNARICRACRRLRWYSYKKERRRHKKNNKVERDKTKCMRGHPYSGENLYVQPDGQRRCRQCKIDARKRHKQTKSA